MRISSAKVLVEQLTLSLLDKAPDNLDFSPVLRLEEYLLLEKKKTGLSHVRDHLNTACTQNSHLRDIHSTSTGERLMSLMSNITKRSKKIGGT